MLRLLADVAKAFDTVADIAHPGELMHQLRFVPPRQRGIDPVGTGGAGLERQGRALGGARSGQRHPGCLYPGG